MTMVWSSDYLGSPGKMVLAKDYPADDDTRAYVAAVESADGQSLEPAVIAAYDNFIVGCKADGIWDAIKASCILAGARTTNGALVPLKGTAPTSVNFDLISDSDYDRKTGLLGDGSTKLLFSNRFGNSDPQNSQHMSVYVSTRPTGSNQKAYIGEASAVGASYIFFNVSNNTIFTSSRTANQEKSISSPNHSGLVGISRSNSSNYSRRLSGSTVSLPQISAAGASNNICVFALGPSPFFHGNPRLAFYSIGEALPDLSLSQTGLALLDTRVSTLISDLGAAI